jgi:hypothetical protein
MPNSPGMCRRLKEQWWGRHGSFPHPYKPSISCVSSLLMHKVLWSEGRRQLHGACSLLFWLLWPKGVLWAGPMEKSGKEIKAPSGVRQLRALQCIGKPSNVGMQLCALQTSVFSPMPLTHPDSVLESTQGCLGSWDHSQARLSDLLQLEKKPIPPSGWCVKVGR